MIETGMRYGNETAFTNRLSALGLVVRERGKGEDQVIQEKWIETVNTPVLVDIDDFEYVCIRMTASQADKLPSQGNNPAFTLIWRSDEYMIEPTEEEAGVLYPWPDAEVFTYDELGEVSGTTFQSIGMIA